MIVGLVLIALVLLRRVLRAGLRRAIKDSQLLLVIFSHVYSSAGCQVGGTIYIISRWCTVLVGGIIDVAIATSLLPRLFTRNYTSPQSIFT